MGPDWNHCLEYEFRLRKEALRLIREQGLSIQRALWTAYEDPQHRMKNWIPFLAVANSRSQSSQSLKEEVALRSPRGQRAQKHPLALKDKPAPRAKEEVKVVAKAITTPQEARLQHRTRTLTASRRSTKGAMWKPRANGNPGNCWRFQRKQCADPTKCNREDVCIRCARPGIPSNDCLCLEAKY